MQNNGKQQRWAFTTAIGNNDQWPSSTLHWIANKNCVELRIKNARNAKASQSDSIETTFISSAEQKLQDMFSKVV